MNHCILRASPLALLIFLAACDTKPTTIIAGGPNDPTASAIANAPPVKLPPAMLASKSYRCKDNSLIFIDWFNDDMTANLHAKEKTATPVNLVAPSAGAPYAGGGYELTGTATAKSITLAKDGASQSCDG